jgi:hypothetical protein
VKRSYLNRKTPLNRLGKKGRAWESARAILKRKFYRRGIVTCELRYEGCYRWQFLGFAHAAKRRKLRPEDLGTAILACSNCHDKIERMPPEEMRRIVFETIERRECEV